MSPTTYQEEQTFAAQQSVSLATHALGALKHTRALAGLSLETLKAKNVHLWQLKDFGFPPSALRDLGYTALDLKTEGAQLRDLIPLYSLKTLVAIYSYKELGEAGFSPLFLQIAGLPLEAGFSLRELRLQRYSCALLLGLGASLPDLLSAGFFQTEFRAIGLSALDLLVADLTIKDCTRAGFSTEQVQLAGYLFSPCRLSKSLYNKIPSVEKPYSKAHKASVMSASAFADFVIKLAGDSELTKQYGEEFTTLLILRKSNQLFDPLPNLSASDVAARAFIFYMSQKEIHRV